MSATEDISVMLRERLRVRGSTFAAQIRKAGRRLPRRVRRAAQFLIETEDLTAHPKLARMVDPDEVSTARDTIFTFLQTVDPKERRKDYLLNILGIIALNVLLIGAAIVTYLVWAGHV